MTDPTPRELLAEADRERRLARGADAARVRIRLFQYPVAHRRTGLFGWVKDRSKAPDPATFEVLDRPVVDAVYAALGVVEREASQRARDLEARVAVEAER